MNEMLMMKMYVQLWEKYNMVNYLQNVDVSLFNNSHVFFLDSNVILDIHHPPSSITNAHRAKKYSNFINKLRKQGCQLCVSSLNIQEVMHVVETIEFNNLTSKVNRKEFRKKNRNNIAVKQVSLWNQIKQNYIILNAYLEKSMLNDYVCSYNCHSYEPVDFLFKKNHPMSNIITADKDFYDDKSLTVYT